MPTLPSNFSIKQLISPVVFLGLAGTVFAHSGPAHEHASGFAAGFTHPIGGIDHLIAMVAVGLLGARLGGRMRWALPLAFVSFMVAGGSAGMAGLSIPMMEAGIAASVLVLGGLLAWKRELPMAAYLALTAGAAMLHGCAHGGEIPAGTSQIPFTAGFVLATTMLHAGGLSAGLLAESLRRDSMHAMMLHRVAGGLAALAGAVLLVLAI